jgi:protein transport protein SEC24
VLQICIDLFLLAQSYVDIATLATLPHTTGGSMYHYLPFNPMMDQDQLLNDLKWNVSRPQVRSVVRLLVQHTAAAASLAI